MNKLHLSRQHFTCEPRLATVAQEWLLIHIHFILGASSAAISSGLAVRKVICLFVYGRWSSVFGLLSFFFGVLDFWSFVFSSFVFWPFDLRLSSVVVPLWSLVFDFERTKGL